MATGGSDGSLNFDTKINTEGFDAGMSTLTKAVEKLSGLIENLTNRMEGSFSGAGSAAQTAAQKVDTVAESARKPPQNWSACRKRRTPRSEVRLKTMCPALSRSVKEIMTYTEMMWMRSSASKENLKRPRVRQPVQ